MDVGCDANRASRAKRSSRCRGRRGSPRGRAKFRAQAGQSTVEWIGLVLLVALILLGLLAAAGGRLPGGALARAIAERIVCAASLGGACSDDELSAAYGPELAALVSKHAPLVRYETGMRALPVDYRRCREDACAEGAESGQIWRSRSGERVTAFTHLVDCRAGAGAGSGGKDGGGERDGGANCSGRRAGNLYVQYWFYYPGSATGEGSIPGVRQGIRWASTKLGKPSFHRDDWESYQVRIGPQGAVSSRASSHHGHVYSGGAGNAVRRPGGRRGTKRLYPSRIEPGGWGPSTGSLYVSGGSHAGRVGTTERSTRVTPASRISLIALERFGDRNRHRFAVSPPWLKVLWRDPEAEGTA